MFDNASSVSIYNSTLVSSDVIHHHTHNDSGPAPLDLLKQHVVLGARHDSSERYDPPKCLPQTRVALQKSITSWVEDVSGNTSPILWLQGAAGAGKSAIAQTLSERWSLKGILAGTFYFSRTAAGRNQSRGLITTLTYQIAQAIPETRGYIENAIRGDWHWDDKPLKEQIMAMIIRPLMPPSTIILPTKVIVIDGLDECCVDLPHQDHEAQQREILEALSLVVEYHIPLKILIASRPERQIRSSFGQHSLQHAVQIKLNDAWNPDKDIELFLCCTFDTLRRERGIEEAWPSKEVVRDLVAKSSGHFIYAAVVIRYISDPRGDPQARLEVIIGLTMPQQISHNPFAQLDMLYLLIMMSIQPDSLPMVLRIFEVMTNAALFDSKSPFNGVTLYSSRFLSKLLFTVDKQILLHLIDLHSILDVPSTLRATNQPITFIHASFSEFLSNPNRSGVFHVDPVQACLNCALQVAKHTIIAMQESQEVEDYSRDALRLSLVQAVKSDLCPPSRDLRMCLYILLGGGRRSYKKYLAALNLPYVIRTQNMRKELSGDESSALLSYLQRCNIPEIEASSWRRWLMAASLVGQKIRVKFLQILAASSAWDRTADFRRGVRECFAYAVYYS